MNRKKGISLMVLVVMIIVMLVLATAVVTISVSAVYNTRVTAFANDLATVQQAVIDYYISTGALPISARTYILAELKNIPSTTTKKNELATALSETGDTGTFYVVDLSKIGVTSSARGTKYNVSNDTDVYVVNSTGTKVYYPLGMTVGSVTYFALTNNLTQATKIEEPTITSATPEGTVNKIKVSKSTNEWTNSITITVVATGVLDRCGCFCWCRCW